MILSVCAKLNDIYQQGTRYKWIKPSVCPRCGSVKIWGHGFVLAYFDGFLEGLLLRRFRCPDCRCIIRMKPKGYFQRFHAAIHTIHSCLRSRLSGGKWDRTLSLTRQRHWLCALKRKAAAMLGLYVDLPEAFERLMQQGIVPVSRGI